MVIAVFVFTTARRTILFLKLQKKGKSACSTIKSFMLSKSSLKTILFKLHLYCMFLDIAASVFFIKIVVSTEIRVASYWLAKARRQKKTRVSFKLIVIGKLSSMRFLSRIYILRRTVF